MQYGLPRLRAQGAALDRNQPPAHGAFQEVGVEPLRLHRNHAGTQPNHGDAAVADMRADVENEVARPNETGQKMPECTILPRPGAVYGQRACKPEQCGKPYQIARSSDPMSDCRKIGRQAALPSVDAAQCKAA